MLLHQLLLQGAARQPDKTAFCWVDRKTSLTYAEAARQMDHFAGALHHLRVVKGDRVTIFAHNGMDYLLGMFACWRIGAIAALVNVRFAGELEYYLHDHQPTVVIYTHDMAEAVRQAAATTPSIRHLVCMDGPQPGAESLPALLAAGLTAPADPGDEAAIAHLSYTSGTTGRPKGACLMHEPTMRATNCIAERLRIASEDISFGPTALSSSYQLVGNLLPPLHRMATVNVMSQWTQQAGWLALDVTQSSLFVANPTLLAEVLEESKLQGRIPGSLRLGLSGGGPVPTALKKAWRDELGIPLVESYGQSELGGFVAMGFPAKEPDHRLGAVGLAQPDKEVAILDKAGKALPVGEVGEICLRGGFMHGYWGKPDKTAEALKDGWLHTGDAGWIDTEGYVTMRGRFSELLTVAEKIWFPRDVEEALADLPEVKAAAVVAIPDHLLGQRPVAYVMLQDETIAPDTLKRLIEHKVPYNIEPLLMKSIAEFPMTPTGKIAKAELRELAILTAL
ncbi:Acyl-CoA synthetase (AMP-forming)/AMP-acid ligase II [Sporomusa malonica]|uniref:Acyl-CoA synthetase (AMP-forming)/AMP-acid ligase II n=2 Tax=Sporomusa malonica TaxID=112901 RepID=A0A1W1Y7Q1_9FIRM|nr:Acyl-CoA synthetase (AMP-forming)/AMP-acid ligase II [Sporomusa malonica]